MAEGKPGLERGKKEELDYCVETDKTAENLGGGGKGEGAISRALEWGKARKVGQFPVASNKPEEWGHKGGILRPIKPKLKHELELVNGKH